MNDDTPGVNPSPETPGEGGPTSISGVYKAVREVDSDIRDVLKKRGFWSTVKMVAAVIATIAGSTWAAYATVTSAAEAQALKTTKGVQEEADSTQRELVRYEGTTDASIVTLKQDLADVKHGQAETQDDIRALYRYMQTRQPQERLERAPAKVDGGNR